MSESQAIPQPALSGQRDSPLLSPGSKRDINIHYPESFLNRHRLSLQSTELPENRNNYKREQKRDLRKNKNRTRYRTQPITFDEIKEVDEENVEPDLGGNRGETGDIQVGSLTSLVSPADLRLDFLQFSKNLQQSVNRKLSRSSRNAPNDEVRRVVASNINNQKT